MTPTLLLLVALPLQAAGDPVDYSTQLKPLLAERCYSCHGALKQEGGLRLDTAAAMRAGGDSGPAVLAGKSSESYLIERVADPDPDTRMPPDGEALPLDQRELALLRAWIDQGAIGPPDEQPESDPREHWAFRAPVRPAVPRVNDSAWVRNPIDAFIAAEHDRLGLSPQGPAEKQLLLRRVYLDLVGLPPTLAELEAFAADTSLDAYEKAVDRLLESPHYAERWGRHWMDIWRYSDWWGLGAEVRNSQKHMWHWRDWIIESLAADLGYDEMLRQMIAADELYPNDLQKLRATGYLARHYFRFNRTTWLDETIEHTSKAFLGLTINCSKCHDHKYDPFSQEDYYRLRAFFEPYQIRTDQVPGEVDLEKDGVPRVFDCHLDAPTWLHVRGDEKQADQTRSLAPGLPGLLEFEDLSIEPVSIPLEAHQPGLRPWVLENHLAAAEQQIAAAREALEQARKALTAAEQAVQDAGKKAADESTAKPEESDSDRSWLVRDDFSTPKPNLWEQVSGEWKHEGGRLVQSSTGPVRGVLRLKLDAPADFEARFRFVIQGGQQWKSVGLAYDAGEEHEVLAYLSALAGGSKVQLAYKQGNAHTYPPGAMQAREVKLDELHELVVRVRGKLVNVLVGGELVLAWTSPLERRAGTIDLVTFDAQAAFVGFDLDELHPSQPLAEAAPPASKDKPAMSPSVEEATGAVALAEKALAAAELQPPCLRARAAADRARFQGPENQAQELARAAALAERRLAAAKAEEAVSRAELELLKTEAAKKADAEKKLAAAREALAKAVQAVEEPGEQYASFVGAVKTIESPVETAESLRRPFPTTSTGRRSALARWMSDPRHPLTARVAVNHIWTRHFNAPLVPTVFDFGRKGDAPTHPALLDWLAVELVEHGWSMKHVHKLIVTSSTYRMASSAAGAEAQQERDPENRYYWRMNATRMEAQVVRDALLHLAGDLDPTVGGPPVPAGQDASRRRGLYFVHSNNDQNRFLSMFDDARVLECYRREQSIVPQQALALSNSKPAMEAAVKIAEGLSAAPEHADDDSFIRAAFLTVLATPPTDEELQACRAACAAWRAAHPQPESDAAKQRARINLVHALLNHNDFVTVR